MNGGGVGVNAGGRDEWRQGRGAAPTLTLPRGGRGFLGLGDGDFWRGREGIFGEGRVGV